MMDTLPAAITAAFALLAAAGLVYFWRIAPVGSGYKAKVVCSAVFGCGRNADDVLALDVAAEAYAIMRPFRTEIDRERRSVTVSFLGMRPKTAVYRPGIGASLSPSPAGPASLPEPGPPANALPAGTARDPERLERAFDAAFAEKNPKRLRRTRAIVVLKDGKLVGERYAPGFSAECRMPGWSVTKSLVNALVGILVRDGKLDVKRDRLFPEWGDERAKITLDDLLRMKSGLEFAEVYEDPLKDVTQMLFNREDAAAYAADKPLAHPPGTVWSYASGTTNLICRLIRETLDGPLEETLAFPRRSLFGPLGMSSALFEPDGAGTLVGSSFGFATARDWARFGQLYLQDGLWDEKRILPPGWTAYSTRPTPESPDGRYGAHWWLQLPEVFGGGSPEAARIPEDAFYALGHEGQTVTVVPSRGLVAVRHGLSIRIDAWNQARFVSDVLEAL
jgi:CubicO group peptidase (beta-lactamase class C family)